MFAKTSQQYKRNHLYMDKLKQTKPNPDLRAAFMPSGLDMITLILQAMDPRGRKEKINKKAMLSQGNHASMFLPTSNDIQLLFTFTA